MARSKISGYVIASYPYKNSGLITKFLTKDGVYTIFGNGFRNVKNKQIMFENRFILIEVDGNIYNDTIRVSECSIKRYDDKLVTNFKINKMLNIISEIILSINELNLSYDLFFYTISKINESNYNTFLAIWLAYAYIHVNRESEFTKCVLCGSKHNINGFDFINNGYICSKCNIYNEIFELKELKDLKKLHTFKYENLEINNLKLIEKYTNYFVSIQGSYLKQLESYVRNI